jgi:hypothetical protein
MTQCAANGRLGSRLCVYRVFEIDKLNLAVKAKEYVFGLDITVRNVLTMRLVVCGGELSDLDGGMLFSESAFCLFLNVRV